MRKQLQQLREAMARAGVSLYVIPTDDFHGSEYVGDYFKCREYVSGFTGSAGTLAVTAERACLWTDGRYFLQAAAELAGSGVELMKMGQPGVPALEAWAEAQLQPGQVLGFDGRTMTLSAGRRLEKAAKKAGAAVRYDLDLAGEIWPDRPGLSAEPVWTLTLEQTGRARKEKLEALRADVRQKGADCHVLTSLDDIAWLLNLRGGDVACNPVFLSFLILDGDGVRLYIDPAKVHDRVARFLERDGVTLRPYLSIFEDVAALPETARVLVDPAKVSFSIVRRIRGRAVEARNPTELPKARKTPTEQENMRAAHVKDGVALVKFMKWLKERAGKEPMTEISAARKLESLRAGQDFYLEPSFEPIFGYGPHGAIIHYSATPETDAEIRGEGFLLYDTGGQYLEGTTDVTRTVALGPATAEMKAHYTMVLRGHLRLMNARFLSGATGASLDILARQPFWEAGMDYNHGTGHGVGCLLNVHEGPQRIHFAAADPAKLEPGMITSDEPGIYLEGKYGIRLENLLLCVEREKNEYGTFLGFEPLTLCPYDLDAVEQTALSPEEKRWLNDYHALVYEKISPFLCQTGRDWLRQATRAI